MSIQVNKETIAAVVQFLEKYGPALRQAGAELTSLYRFVQSHRQHPGLTPAEREELEAFLSVSPGHPPIDPPPPPPNDPPPSKPPTQGAAMYNFNRPRPVPDDETLKSPEYGYRGGGEGVGDQVMESDEFDKWSITQVGDQPNTGFKRTRFIS